MSVTEVGRTTSAVTGTSADCTVSSDVPVGHALVMTANSPSGVAATTWSVTDTKGNSWHKRVAIPGSSKAPSVWDCIVTNALVGGVDKVTLTQDKSSSVWLMHIADEGVMGGFDQSGSNEYDTTTGPVSVTSDSNAAQNTQTAVVAFTNTNVTHVPTPASGWTQFAVLQVGTGSGASQMWVQYREFTTGSGAPRVGGATYSTIATTIGVMDVMNAYVAPPPPTAPPSVHHMMVSGSWVRALRKFSVHNSSWA